MLDGFLLFTTELSCTLSLVGSLEFSGESGSAELGVELFSVTHLSINGTLAGEREKKAALVKCPARPKVVYTESCLYQV